MCGIAAISAAERADGPDMERALSRMLQALRHRGPDDSGSQALPERPEEARTVFVGATRLAILDLTQAGHQPMRDPATGNWIVLNGEIYNHADVRQALGEAAGPWASRSDTETVLRAYGRWGPACLGRLRGMFALAIWDAREAALCCARDRLGIKPLYYWTGSGRVVLASEVRALLASGLVPRRLDLQGLAGFVRFGSVPEPLTLVAGVGSLPPGHWMKVRAGRVEEVRPYWRPDSAPDEEDPADAPRVVRRHLERSVREHLLSDVPVAAFLSGGMDSSIVTALAARAAERPIRTFSVGFREPALDESAQARTVATRYGTDHRRVLLADEEVARSVLDAVRSMDLPSADGLNTFVISRAVALEGIKVALSGLGGDELFGGYRSFRLLPKADRWAFALGWLPQEARRLAVGGGSSGERAVEITGRGSSLSDRYQSLRSFWSMRELREMGLEPGIGYGVEDLEGAPLPARVSGLELGGYMRSTLLRDGDAMAMAHSLELRIPFLDHELVECCLRLVAASPRWGRGPKPLLRLAAGDILPHGIATRPKRGFVLPMDRWMRGPLRPFVSEGLERAGRCAALSRLDMGELLGRFEAGRLPWARLWEFVVLGHWLARHLDTSRSH